MRRNAKGWNAGSDRQQNVKFVLPVSLSVALLALLVIAGSAVADKSHAFKEVFGSAAQPSFGTARSLAVDQSTGDVLVMDNNAKTISRFKPDGTADNFSALGSNVIDGKEGPDATPQEGLSFASASESQIAVDNSGTATDGDIYVTQGSPNLINIFSSAGEYLGQLTAAGTTNFSEACGVAVDPSGNVYVGDYSSGLHVFKQPGTPHNPLENTDNTATFTTASQPCALAAGTGPTAGSLFAAAKYNGPIAKLDASTGELKYTVSSDRNTTVSIDPETGHVYAGTGRLIKEFDASGTGGASVISSATELTSSVQGLAVRGTTGDIFASRSGSNTQLDVFGSTVVTSPNVTTETATANTGVHATLNGSVNPDEVELSECFFEWGKSSSAEFENTTACAESNATIGTGTTPVPVHVDLSNLQPNGVTYKFRLVAKNAETPAVVGSQLTFRTPDTVITTAATGTTSTSATVNGTINPDGVTVTECLFEWGTTTNYDQTASCVPDSASIGSGTTAVAVHADLAGLHSGTTYHYRLRAANANGAIRGSDETVLTSGPVIAAAWAQAVIYNEATLTAEINPEGASTTYHIDYGPTAAYGSQTLELSVGTDSTNHEVTRSLRGLASGTTYHYRVVVTNAVAVNEGADHTFATFEPLSPDTSCSNRAYRSGPGAELPDCRAYEMVSPVEKNGGDISTAANISALESGLFQSSTSGNRMTYSSYKAFGEAQSAPYTSQYMASRTSSGWSTDPISPPRGVKILGSGFSLDSEYKAFSPDLAVGYLRHDSDPPLASGAPEGFANLYERATLSGAFRAITTRDPEHYPITFLPEFQGASEDGQEVLVSSQGSLAAGAPNIGGFESFGRSLYLWADGSMHPVSVLPDGEPNTTGSGAGAGEGGGDNRAANVRNAISNDGSRIFWTAEIPHEFLPSGQIFVRENPSEPQSAVDSEGNCLEPEKACTKAISQKVSNDAATYWTASADGSSVLFSVGSSLYEFDVQTGSPTEIAGEVTGVLGAGEDLGDVYFVSKEDLAPGAAEGAPNLYVRRGSTEALVATLSNQDVSVLEANPISLSPFARDSRVTPDGKTVVFMSNRSLTGYDNTDASTGEPLSEVYRYSADQNSLVCGSCRASQARPEGKVLDRPHAHAYEPLSLRVAAWIPTWERQLYGSHVVTDSGNRVFFNSYDALVPGDTNGKADVYEWEERGTGSCDRSEGCVSLISTGESATGAEFVDSSNGGRDIFFRTDVSIAPQDPGLIDIYDARIDGGFASPGQEKRVCAGDSCQSPSSAPPVAGEGSAIYRGPGNRVAQRARRCHGSASAKRLSRRARRLRRRARHVSRRSRARLMHRKAGRLARRARRISRSTRRCRRVQRRAER